MYVDFEKLPGHARVWVYMSDSKLSASQQQHISDQLSLFTKSWVAHGTPLSASFKILNDHFVVLAVDDHFNDASGCSIDASVHAVKLMQQELDVDFFNRNLVPFYHEGNVDLVARKNVRQNLEEGIWNGETVTFNILAKTVEDIQTSWLIKAEDSWLAMYLKRQPTVNL